MTTSGVSKPKRRVTLRGVVIVLLVLATLTLVLVLVLPTLIFRVLNFVPKGDVQTFWSDIQQTGTAPGMLPSILETRLPPQVIALPTLAQTMTPFPSPSELPATSQPNPIVTTFAHTLTPAQQQPQTLSTEPVTPTIRPSLTPTPTPTNPYANLFSTSFEPDKIRLFSAGHIDLTINGSQVLANTLWVGQDTKDNPLGIVEIDENTIPQLCSVYLNNCTSPQFRVDKVDFRPGGILIYGSINVANLFWQQVGVALLLDSDGLTLKLAGMIWNNEVYEMPKTGQLAETLQNIAGRGNDALRTLNIYVTGYDMTVAQMYADDNRFIVILQSANKP